MQKRNPRYELLNNNIGFDWTEHQRNVVDSYEYNLTFQLELWNTRFVWYDETGWIFSRLLVVSTQRCTGIMFFRAVQKLTFQLGLWNARLSWNDESGWIFVRLLVLLIQQRTCTMFFQVVCNLTFKLWLQNEVLPVSF
jgi:hypothetical protein